MSENTWDAPIYVTGQFVIEWLPVIMIIVSTWFAVNERARAIASYHKSATTLTSSSQAKRTSMML